MRKSIGVETTFKNDTRNIGVLSSCLYEFSVKISQLLKTKRLHCKTVTVKIKFDDFRMQTKSKTLLNNIIYTDDIYKVGVSLLKRIHIMQNVRLIGLAVSNLSSLGLEQLSLFDSMCIK